MIIILLRKVNYSSVSVSKIVFQDITLINIDQHTTLLKIKFHTLRKHIVWGTFFVGLRLMCRINFCKLTRKNMFRKQFVPLSYFKFDILRHSNVKFKVILEL